MIKLEKLVFNSFQVNSYILHDETKECIIIDPACYSDQEKEQLKNFILQHLLKPVLNIYTHCHVDHILGMHYVKQQYNIPAWAHEKEMPALKNGTIMGDLFGFITDPFPLPEKFIQNNEIISFGNSKIKAIPVPGHSEGSLAYYSEEDEIVITGDALFAGSIGRTDLPGGNYDTLISSIQSELFTLPGNTKVFPGHGATSTIEKEMKENPFFNA